MRILQWHRRENKTLGISREHQKVCSHWVSTIPETKMKIKTFYTPRWFSHVLQCLICQQPQVPKRSLKCWIWWHSQCVSLRVPRRSRVLWWDWRQWMAPVFSHWSLGCRSWTRSFGPPGCWPWWGSAWSPGFSHTPAGHCRVLARTRSHVLGSAKSNSLELWSRQRENQLLQGFYFGQLVLHHQKLQSLAWPHHQALCPGRPEWRKVWASLKGFCICLPWNRMSTP